MNHSRIITSSISIALLLVLSLVARAQDTSRTGTPSSNELRIPDSLWTMALAQIATGGDQFGYGADAMMWYDNSGNRAANYDLCHGLRSHAGAMFITAESAAAYED